MGFLFVLTELFIKAFIHQALLVELLYFSSVRGLKKYLIGTHGNR